jgi:tetratricopeptide (TPR) repeat protein
MATAAPETAPDPTRHLWQVPVFLVGLAAFLAAWQGWLPIGSPDPTLAFQKDLAVLRGAAERTNPDAAELKALLAKTAVAVDTFPEAGSAAHFALGSGYARLAELTASPDDARVNWELARQHFDRVKPDQLSDPLDPPRLAFRKAKTRVAVGLPHNSTAAEINLYRQILQNTPPNEEPGEANRLLAELCLLASPPDPKRAKEALTAYLTEAGLSTPPASLARAKLRLSELHLLTGDNKDARKWLAQVGPDSPPDVLATAKAQLARILMREGDFAKAIEAWDVVRASSALPAALKTVAAYHLGECKLATRQFVEATRLFEEAARSETTEGPAAAIRLADLYLQTPDAANHKRAAALLAGAVRGLKEPSDYGNPLVPLNEVRAAFEAAVQALLTDAAFEEAAATAEAYKVVATGGRDREKRAEVHAAWGTVLRAAKGEYASKFAAAAEEYAALAEMQPAASAKIDLLRRAYAMHRQADDSAAALVAIKKAVDLSDPGEAAGPVWVDYTDALIATGRPEKEVVRAINEALASGGPAATAARYRWARYFIDSRDPKKVPLGTGMLEQIADQATVGAAEQGTHERAMMELADVAVRAGQFEVAEARLRKQLNLYPAGPESGVGRLLLGVCLLQRAAGKSAETDWAGKQVQMRDEALRLFKGIVADTDRQEKVAPGGKLSERDEWLRLHAGLRVVQSYQQMGNGEAVLVYATPMVERHRGTIEELIVLSMVWNAQQRQLGKPEDAARTKDRMRDLFNQLPPSAFRATTGEYSREYWEKGWFAPSGANND